MDGAKLPAVVTPTIEWSTTLLGCPKLSTITDSSGKSWREVRKTLRLNVGVMMLHVLVSVLMAALAPVFMWGCRHLGIAWFEYAAIPFSALWLTYWYQSYTAHFHEAAHFNIAPSRWLNDMLAWVFLTPFIGLDIRGYRTHHWEHHKFLGDSRDTEISYHKRLTSWRILESLTGWYLLRTVFHYLRISHETTQSTAAPKALPYGASVRMLLAIVLALTTQLSIAGTLAHFVSTPAGISWALAFFCWGPFLANLRQTLEHRSLSAPKDVNFTEVAHGPVNYMFGTGVFARFFGAGGFNRHLLHHWEPQISYTRFNEMESFFIDTVLKTELDKNRTTYLANFKAMFEWR